MKYRWAEGDAGHLLGEIYSEMIGSPTPDSANKEATIEGRRRKQVSSNRGSSLRYEGLKKAAEKWIRKAIKCRKEILDPKVKESEAILKRIS